MGKSRPTGQFSAGRQVFYNRRTRRYLSVYPCRRAAWGSRYNAEDSEIENEDKVIEAVKKLTKQLESWSPDQPAFAFYIPPDEAQAGREAMEQAVERSAEPADTFFGARVSGWM